MSLSKKVYALHTAKQCHAHINPMTVEIKEKNNIHLKHSFDPLPFESCHFQNLHYNKNNSYKDFLSPEQKGITRCKVDYRSDMYAIGAMLYFWQGNHAPFICDNGETLLFSNASLSKHCQFIIEKLLSRFPEDRYQSLSGLLDDLDYSQKEGKLFFPGKTDIPEILIFNSYHFGRTKAQDFIRRQGDIKNNTHEKILFISGEAGVGKTTFIKSYFSYFNGSNGLFLNGCKKIANGTLTPPILGAIIELIEKKLNNNDKKQIEDFANHMNQYRDILQLYIPELCNTINKKKQRPSSNFLDTVEMYTRCFSYFAKKNTPIILFLDDIQWFSKNQLETISHLYKKNIPYFQIICTFRKNECLYSSLFKEFECSFTEKNHLTLDNLDKNASKEWFQDLLKINKTEASQLAELIYSKSIGNPYYTRKLLEALYSESLILFDSKQKKWLCNKQKISAYKISDNLSERIYPLLKGIPEEIKKTLITAACLKTPFNADQLSSYTLYPKKLIELQLDILRLLLIVIPLEKKTFIISNDSIAQIIRNSISEDERALVYRKIARYNIIAKAKEPDVSIVEHISQSINAVQKKDILPFLIFLTAFGLNQKNKRHFKNALKCFQTATMILPKSYKENSYRSLWFILHKEVAVLLFQCAFYNESSEKLSYLKSFPLTHSEIHYLDASSFGIFSKKKTKHPSLFLIRNMSNKIHTIKNIIKKNTPITPLQKLLKAELKEAIKTEHTLIALSLLNFLFAVKTKEKRIEKWIILAFLIYHYPTSFALLLLITTVANRHIYSHIFLKKIVAKSIKKITSHKHPMINTQFLSFYYTHCYFWGHTFSSTKKRINKILSHAKTTNNKTLSQQLQLDIIHIQFLNGDHPKDMLEETQLMMKGKHVDQKIYMYLRIYEAFSLSFLERKKTLLSKNLIHHKDQSYKEKENSDICLELLIKKSIAYFLLNKTRSEVLVKKALNKSKYCKKNHRFFELQFWSSVILSTSAITKKRNPKEAKKIIKSTLRFFKQIKIKRNTFSILPYENTLKGIEKLLQNKREEGIKIFNQTLKESEEMNHYWVQLCSKKLIKIANQLE